MQLDMHYYGTYALARAAGLNPDFAKGIATAAQFVDDSTGVVGVLSDGVFLDFHATAHHPVNVHNVNETDQRHVWVPFHFLPGCEGNTLEEKLICKKDSDVAQEMVAHHLAADVSFKAILMGITAHVYADTFSHYGFSGISSDLNRVDRHSVQLNAKDPNMLDYVRGKAEKFWHEYNVADEAAGIVGLGHGEAATYPDRPYLNWRFQYQNGADSGLRENQQTFLDGCKKLHGLFAAYCRLGNGSFGTIADIRSFDEIQDSVSKVLAVEADMQGRIDAWNQAAKVGNFFSNPAGEGIPEYDEQMFRHDFELLKTRKYEEIRNTVVFEFMQAADYHRNYVLRELLPKHEVIVIQP